MTTRIQASKQARQVNIKDLKMDPQWASRSAHKWCIWLKRKLDKFENS